MLLISKILRLTIQINVLDAKRWSNNVFVLDSIILFRLRVCVACIWTGKNIRLMAQLDQSTCQAICEMMRQLVRNFRKCQPTEVIASVALFFAFVKLCSQYFIIVTHQHIDPEKSCMYKRVCKGAKQISVMLCLCVFLLLLLFLVRL